MPLNTRHYAVAGLSFLVLSASRSPVLADQAPPDAPMTAPADPDDTPTTPIGKALKAYDDIEAADRILSNRIEEFLSTNPLSGAPREVRDFLRAKSQWISETKEARGLFLQTWQFRLVFRSTDPEILSLLLENDGGTQSISRATAWIKRLMGGNTISNDKKVPAGGGPKKPADDSLKNVDFCTDLMLQAAKQEGKSDARYSDADLANIALGVKCNNALLGSRRLLDNELYLFALQVNVVAEKRGLTKIDADTMRNLSIITDRERQREEWDRFDKNVNDYLKDAPDDFKQKALEIMAHAVYRSSRNR